MGSLSSSVARKYAPKSVMPKQWDSREGQVRIHKTKISVDIRSIKCTQSHNPEPFYTVSVHRVWNNTIVCVSLGIEYTPLGLSIVSKMDTAPKEPSAIRVVKALTLRSNARFRWVGYAPASSVRLKSDWLAASAQPSRSSRGTIPSQYNS